MAGMTHSHMFDLVYALFVFYLFGAIWLLILAPTEKRPAKKTIFRALLLPSAIMFVLSVYRLLISN